MSRFFREKKAGTDGSELAWFPNNSRLLDGFERWFGL
jgi:hypothetical protein